MIRSINSEEDAREFYLTEFAFCPPRDHDCYSQELLYAYYKYSSHQKEWAREEFNRLLAEITFENERNLQCLSKVPIIKGGKYGG